MMDGDEHEGHEVEAHEVDGHEDEVAQADAGVAEGLRTALGQMREEADRIAALDTGDEQVQAAERFAEAAGTLDEQIGSSARADDERRS